VHPYTRYSAYFDAPCFRRGWGWGWGLCPGGVVEHAVVLSSAVDNSLSVRDLKKTYGDVQALDGISFDVEAGTVFGLLGPNGAGKSTTVKILTTLSRADSGTATVAGYDVNRDPVAVRRQIGVVAQNSGTDIQLTGRENLILQGQVFGMAKDEIRKRADQLLTDFGLAEAADRTVNGYSGGMRRRLDIATALVHSPKVLFLDEPTTGLDPEVRAAMWTEIRRLSEEHGLTILLTTHYLEEADSLASQLVIVDRGRNIVSGSPEQLKGELKGDAIRLEWDRETNLEQVQAALAEIDGVGEVTVEGHTTHARVPDGAKAVAGVLGSLATKGFNPESVTVARPSLDDVYLRYTGRSYSEADTEGEAGNTEEETN